MNNEEKNTYVKKQISQAFIALLKEKEFDEINISEITEKAGVSRNSFYRNYKNKEEILSASLQSLLNQWIAKAESCQDQSKAAFFGSLFQHIEDHQDFYLLLKKRNLFHLFLNCFMELFKVDSITDNPTAYGLAFVSYGIYGWVTAWIDRGMTEDATLITQILLANGLV